MLLPAEDREPVGSGSTPGGRDRWKSQGEKKLKDKDKHCWRTHTVLQEQTQKKSGSKEGRKLPGHSQLCREGPAHMGDVCRLQGC